MAKRYTDSRKWDDPWFTDLELKDKMFWTYILDKCDHAGIYKPNIRLASFLIGEDCVQEVLLDTFKERVRVLSNGDWFIPKFISFQYGELDESNRCHKSVIEILKRKGAFKTLGRPFKGCKSKDKDKDKDKEQDKDKKEQERILVFRFLKDNDFNLALNNFLDMRKEIKAKATEHAIDLILKKLHGYTLSTAIAMLNQSTENSWKGIFPLKTPPDPVHRPRRVGSSSTAKDLIAKYTKENDDQAV